MQRFGAPTAKPRRRRRVWIKICGQLPLHALAAKLKSRSISPVDIVDTCLERIARLDPKLHAFVEVYEAEARLAAEAADKAIRSGHAVGPLHGIPIALKDLIELEGRVATGGTAVWRDRAPPAPRRWRKS